MNHIHTTFTTYDLRPITRLVVGDRATMVTTLRDPEGHCLDIIQQTKVWLTDRGLCFHNMSFMAALNLDNLVRPRLERIIDTETLRNIRVGPDVKFEDATVEQQQERKRLVTEHLYLSLEQATLIAGMSLVLVGFSPLAQLLVQPALRGHSDRIARWLPVAACKERPPAYHEEELGITPETRYCNWTQETPDY